MATSTIPMIGKNQTGTLTGTISSDNAEFVSGSYTVVGNAIYVGLNLQTTTAIAAGGTITGTISGLPSDIHSIGRGVSWASASGQIISLTAAGSLTIRVIGATISSGSTIASPMIGMMTSIY